MRPLLPLFAAFLAGCTMLVPDPSATPPGALPPGTSAPEPSTPPGVVRFPQDGEALARRAFDPLTPAHPVLLRDLGRVEDADGALILTHGTILNDVAAIAGGSGMLHDPVLDDVRGSLRLRPTQPVLAAANQGPRLVRGILHREPGGLRLEVLSIDPLPVTTMENLTVDDRLYEPGERLTVAPGLRRITVDAPGLAAVEFIVDDRDGPLERLGRDEFPTDGFSATWIASALEDVTIRTLGFTVFGETVQGPSLQVRVGPLLDW